MHYLTGSSFLWWKHLATFCVLQKHSIATIFTTAQRSETYHLHLSVIYLLISISSLHPLVSTSSYQVLNLTCLNSCDICVSVVQMKWFWLEMYISKLSPCFSSSCFAPSVPFPCPLSSCPSSRSYFLFHTCKYTCSDSKNMIVDILRNVSLWTFLFPIKNWTFQNHSHISEFLKNMNKHLISLVLIVRHFIFIGYLQRP